MITPEAETDPRDDPFRAGIIGAIPKLRAYATSLLGSASEADDLVQDSLVRAWRSRQTFASGTNLNAWMFRILRNEFLGQLPKRRRMVADVDGLLAAQLISAPDQEWRVQVSDVVAALPRLSHEHREALLLVVAAGHSYEDAADICACGVNAMKQRVRRARMHLAALTDPDPPAAWPKAASDRPPDAYRPPAADPGLEGPMAAAQPPPVTLGGPALRRSGDT